MSEGKSKSCTTTDEAIRKILQQSSFPKSSSALPPASNKRRAAGTNHARKPPPLPPPAPAPMRSHQQSPVTPLAPHTPPPTQYTVVVDTLPPQYDIYHPYPVTTQYVPVHPPQHQHHPHPPPPPEYHQQQQYDFSVSDSDRLVRALGLDFSEPVQRELSAK